MSYAEAAQHTSIHPDTESFAHSAAPGHQELVNLPLHITPPLAGTRHLIREKTALPGTAIPPWTVSCPCPHTAHARHTCEALRYTDSWSTPASRARLSPSIYQLLTRMQAHHAMHDDPSSCIAGYIPDCPSDPPSLLPHRQHTSQQAPTPCTLHHEPYLVAGRPLLAQGQDRAASNTPVTQPA